ncbi:MAG: hypothetical protein JG782_1199 [Anaerophaga sp.]|nr:hypothetical protein [Anaerophaga sp.]MDN5291722.1 hypothetical protein [Anaerophaga sp.]
MSLLLKELFCQYFSDENIISEPGLKSIFVAKLVVVLNFLHTH